MSYSPSNGDLNSPYDTPEGTDDDNTKKSLESVEFKAEYVFGDQLQHLRQQVRKLREELLEAKTIEDAIKVLELEREIFNAQQRDAEFVYSVSMESMENAETIGKFSDANKYLKEAINARNSLPQFNLHGLWVGKYGDHGYEMVNVTYVGDTLFAHKVTGDRNVPKGELSFTADLSPLGRSKELLEPIELADSAAKQWGSKYLPRFIGQGPVAAEGFENDQSIEGQLILANEFFSFAWVPIGYQVLFGRPTAELTLQLLRDAEKSDDHSIEKARDYIRRCMEESRVLEEESYYENGLSNEMDNYGAPGAFE